MQFRASLTIAGLFAGASIGFAGVASSALAYPTPPVDITATVTLTTPNSPVGFTGTGFKDGSEVKETTHSTVTTQVLTADATGTVKGQTSVSEMGLHTITLDGVDPSGSPRNLMIHFTVATAAGTGIGTGLPFTGAEIGGAAGLGALLLGAGGFVLLASRRRRQVVTEA